MKYYGKQILTGKNYAIINGKGEILEKYRTKESARADLRKWKGMYYYGISIIKLEKTHQEALKWKLTLSHTWEQLIK